MKTAKNLKQQSGPQQVADFMTNLEHPLKQAIEEVLQIIRSADGRITEQIKWNAPSFCVNYEDRFTLNLPGKGFFRLIFHCGAKVRDNTGAGQLFEDPTGLLDWASGDRAIVKFTDLNDVTAKKDKLKEVIRMWIEATDFQAGTVHAEV
ncbi:DUF1801 domain-containing protein [Paenibacillus oenotherae]|uniref:DUF1801 domain-containing protein n=1 Tax=Paenibacillus oenotherae TaxID=1435645 RepID=UPI0031BAB99C